MNHRATFSLDVSWGDFEWEITRKLRAHPSDVILSYRLASQPKTEMARALADEKDLEDLMQRCEPFVDGTKKCGRGKEFCVQLFAKITASEDAPTPTQTRKVCFFLTSKRSIPLMDRKGKAKQKAKQSGSKNNDEGGTAQKLSDMERTSSRLMGMRHCATHNRSCAVSDTGVHVRLVPEDFVKWATLIVSRLSHELRGALTHRVNHTAL